MLCAFCTITKSMSEPYSVDLCLKNQEHKLLLSPAWLWLFIYFPFWIINAYLNPRRSPLLWCLFSMTYSATKVEIVWKMSQHLVWVKSGSIKQYLKWHSGYNRYSHLQYLYNYCFQNRKREWKRRGGREWRRKGGEGGQAWFFFKSGPASLGLIKH